MSRLIGAHEVIAARHSRRREPSGTTGATVPEVGVNPTRHREQLIRGLDDEGLEELTLRYFKPDHPDAHRTRRGVDGGLDVLSDYELPPARGWQCKTSTNAEADWRECRRSIEAAMADDDRPGHYTFVFNFVLSAGQRNFWRKTLLPELRDAYRQLTTIDYIDDFDKRIDGRDDLLDWLVDGAYGAYVRRTLQGTPDESADRRAGPPDADDAQNGAAEPAGPTDGFSVAAEHAKRLGRDDKAYSYGVAGREATGRDQALGDRVAHFSMSAGQRDRLPSFSVKVRNGDAVIELSATPRAGATVQSPQPWFAPTAEGARARAAARAQLAKGREVALRGRHVGVVGGDVPQKFAEWMDPGQRSESGQLAIGLSEPLALTLTMEPPGIGAVEERVAMYRVPPEPGADLAYAGAIGGAVLAIDVTPAAPPPGVQADRWVDCRFTVTLSVGGENATTALTGLGFARAFGSAGHRHFTCLGLLPTEGYDIDGQLPLGDEEAETWVVAATLATALQALTDRDGLDRAMPEALGPVDLARAQKVLHLLDGPLEVVVEEARFKVLLPPQAALDDDPRRWLRFSAEFGPLVGQDTGLTVEQAVVGADAVAIEDVGDGQLALVCAGSAEGPSIVVRLVDAPAA